MRTLAEMEKVLDKVISSLDATEERRVEREKEMERVLAERRAETERALAESRKENERMLAASRAELDQKMSELTSEVKSWVSRFGNNIGYIVEVVLVPGLKEKMNELGHNFDRLLARDRYYRKDGSRLLEVDLLLENCDETMAVEVKTWLSKDGVESHVKRLKKMRDNEESTKIAGKRLYSAVAGLDIDEDARELALSLGMYVIEMYEDKKLISIIKPAGEVKVW